MDKGQVIKIAVIVGSTRDVRVTPKMAKWLASVVEQKNDSQSPVEVSLLDLEQYNLPMFNEDLPPQFNSDRQLADNVKQWLEDVSRADGYIIVSPEYNRSMSGVIKNALDHVDFQLKRKPVLLASHGSTGGAQAIMALRSVIGGMKAVSLPDPVCFVGRVADAIDENGKLDEAISSKERGPHVAASNGVDELLWYARALKQAR